MKRVLVFMLLSFCLLTPALFADQPSEKAVAKTETVSADKSGSALQVSGAAMPDLTSTLLVFLVLSVVFEVALTPVFNWRVFLIYMEGQGLKTPITVILAFLVFWSYNLDIITDLLVALNKLPATSKPSFGGQVITALLIAGGSNGVFQIFKTLNIREKDKDRQEKVEKVRKDFAKQKAQPKE